MRCLLGLWRAVPEHRTGGQEKMGVYFAMQSTMPGTLPASVPTLCEFSYPKCGERSALGSSERDKTWAGRAEPTLLIFAFQSVDSEDSFVPGRRASLSDLTELEDIEGLSVRQLKEILARNFVTYKGCCEKWELMERVTRLYKDQKGLQHRGEGLSGGPAHTSLSCLPSLKPGGLFQGRIPATSAPASDSCHLELVPGLG